MVSQKRKEQIAMGMLLSTSDKQFVGGQELRKKTEENLVLLKDAVVPIMREDYPKWSQYRYDLLVGLDSNGSVSLFPVNSTRPKRAVLLSEVFEKGLREAGWLLSAPVYRTSENTVRAMYTLSESETEIGQYTDQARWGAVTADYRNSVFLEESFLDREAMWKNYVHCVLTGEYPEGNISGGEVAGVGTVPSAEVSEKNLGGSSLLDIASRI